MNVKNKTKLFGWQLHLLRFDYPCIHLARQWRIMTDHLMVTTEEVRQPVKTMRHHL